MTFLAPEVAAEVAPEVESIVAPTVAKDFNDAPVAKTLGSRFGSTVKNNLAFHGIESMLGLGGHGGGGGNEQAEQGPPTGGVDLGTFGNVG
jgi:hypothetical protein